MLKVIDIINKVRSLTHDNNELGWNDDEVLDVINSGYRFINRVIKDIKPNLLANETFTTTLKANTNKIKLRDMVIRIISVYVNGNELMPLNKTCFKTDKLPSIPTSYTLNNFNTLTISPAPIKDCEVEIDYVPDSKELTLDDVTPLPLDFDDALIEYVIIRLSMSNEFDVTQEATLMQTVFA